ncbi:SPW repeat protein [Actinokineospora sp. HUAS TT18]|uniref:SPW repeat protein n=1 Tax=Actinokineospora sp. HUAS TT18 TaxID=3447451 RepID=UPI003F51F219
MVSISESGSVVKPWTRPYDWAEVVLGVVAMASPLWMDTDNAAMWTMVVLGALIALDGLVSLAMPGMVAGEAVQIVLGVLMFISPWVMSYTDMTGIAWSSWIIGALTVVAGAAALPLAQAASRMAGSH